MWAFLLDEKKYQESIPKKLFDKRNIKGSIQFVFSGNIDNSWFPHITFYIQGPPYVRKRSILLIASQLIEGAKNF